MRLEDGASGTSWHRLLVAGNRMKTMLTVLNLPNQLDCSCKEV